MHTFFSRACPECLGGWLCFVDPHAKVFFHSLQWDIWEDEFMETFALPTFAHRGTIDAEGQPRENDANHV